MTTTPTYERRHYEILKIVRRVKENDAQKPTLVEETSESLTTEKPYLESSPLNSSRNVVLERLDSLRSKKAVNQNATHSVRIHPIHVETREEQPEHLKVIDIPFTKSSDHYSKSSQPQHDFDHVASTESSHDSNSTRDNTTSSQVQEALDDVLERPRVLDAITKAERASIWDSDTSKSVSLKSQLNSLEDNEFERTLHHGSSERSSTPKDNVVVPIYAKPSPSTSTDEKSNAVVVPITAHPQESAEDLPNSIRIPVSAHPFTDRPHSSTSTDEKSNVVVVPITAHPHDSTEELPNSIIIPVTAWTYTDRPHPRNHNHHHNNTVARRHAFPTRTSRLIEFCDHTQCTHPQHSRNVPHSKRLELPSSYVAETFISGGRPTVYRSVIAEDPWIVKLFDPRRHNQHIRDHDYPTGVHFHYLHQEGNMLERDPRPHFQHYKAPGKISLDRKPHHSFRNSSGLSDTGMTPNGTDMRQTETWVTNTRRQDATDTASASLQSSVLENETPRGKHSSDSSDPTGQRSNDGTDTCSTCDSKASETCAICDQRKYGAPFENIELKLCDCSLSRISHSNSEEREMFGNHNFNSRDTSTRPKSLFHCCNSVHRDATSSGAHRRNGDIKPGTSGKHDTNGSDTFRSFGTKEFSTNHSETHSNPERQGSEHTLKQYSNHKSESSGKYVTTDGFGTVRVGFERTTRRYKPKQSGTHHELSSGRSGAHHDPDHTATLHTTTEFMTIKSLPLHQTVDSGTHYTSNGTQEHNNSRKPHHSHNKNVQTLTISPLSPLARKQIINHINHDHNAEHFGTHHRTNGSSPYHIDQNHNPEQSGTHHRTNGSISKHSGAYHIDHDHNPEHSEMHHRSSPRYFGKYHIDHNTEHSGMHHRSSPRYFGTYHIDHDHNTENSGTHHKTSRSRHSGTHVNDTEHSGTHHRSSPRYSGTYHINHNTDNSGTHHKTSRSNPRHSGTHVYYTEHSGTHHRSSPRHSGTFHINHDHNTDEYSGSRLTPATLWSCSGTSELDNERRERAARERDHFFHIFKHSFEDLIPPTGSSDTAFFGETHVHAIPKEDMKNLTPPHFRAERMCKHLPVKTHSRSEDGDWIDF